MTDADTEYRRAADAGYAKRRAAEIAALKHGQALLFADAQKLATHLTGEWMRVAPDELPYAPTVTLHGPAGMELRLRVETYGPNTGRVNVLGMLPSELHAHDYTKSSSKATVSRERLGNGPERVAAELQRRVIDGLIQRHAAASRNAVASARAERSQGDLIDRITEASCGLLEGDSSSPTLYWRIPGSQQVDGNVRVNSHSQADVLVRSAPDDLAEMLVATVAEWARQREAVALHLPTD